MEVIVIRPIEGSFGIYRINIEREAGRPYYEIVAESENSALKILTEVLKVIEKEN
jgi:hypothetical protein